MTITYSKQYMKRTLSGNLLKVFIYTVEGTKEEMIGYKFAQDSNYREDEDGRPLFFTHKYMGAWNVISLDDIK